MSEQTTSSVPPLNQAARDPAVFKVLDNGTVLYKSWQQAEAARQQKLSGQSPETAKILSQVKYGEKYLAKNGQAVPYTLKELVEFQCTGLIVVLVVLAGLSLICSAIGRLMKVVDQGPVVVPATSADASPDIPGSSPVAASCGHSVLSDQDLLVVLAAAACEVMGGPVRVEKIRPLTSKDRNWAVQGRSDLHSHRLK